jgi:hypothetical protein
MSINKHALFYVLLVAFAFNSQAHAQSDTTGHLEIGPIFIGGASMFMGTVPEGSEARPSAAYEVGCMEQIHLDEDYAITAVLAYESRSMYFQAEGDPAFNQKISINYVTSQVGLKWRQLLLLTVIGFPVSGYQTIRPYDWIYTTEQNPDPIAEFKSGPIDVGMNDLLIDVRIAGLIPLMEFEGNHLDLFMQATYSLSNAIGEDGFQISPNYSTHERVTKSPITTIQAGVSYFFSLR